MAILKLLVLDCSPRGERSTSRYLTACLLPALFEKQGQTLQITRRLLGREPLAAISVEYAESLLLSARQAAALYGTALSISDTLIEELHAADILWISTPVHNFTVPAVLKHWIDLVVRKDVTFVTTGEGKKGLLRDRPVFIAVTSGGAMFDDHAGQPDFFRPYLRAILGVIGLQNVTFIPATKLAGGVAPLDDVAAIARSFLDTQLTQQAAQH